MLKFRLISQLLQLFVLPELEKRISDGVLDASKLPLDLRQFRAIQRKLPNGDVLPITEINDEIQLKAQVKYRRAVTAGQPLTLNDIYPDQCYIEPPNFDGKAAAYFLYQSVVFGYYLFFDCRPNLPDLTDKDLEEVKAPYPILEFINAKEFLRTVNPADKLRLLATNNWPPAPGYYPSTLAALHRDPTIINDERIVAEVSQSYNRPYWEERLSFWRETAFFPKRLKYVEKAITAHFTGDYTCSIYVLVPQFEGILRDCLQECKRNSPPGFVQAVQELRALVFSRKVVMFPRDILGAIFDFLRTGTFWRYTSTIADPSAAINRHGIAHGVFADFENEVISLKYLILLDAMAMVLLHDRIVAGSLG